MAEFTKLGGATLTSQHTFSEEEKVAFSTHINQCLGADPVLARHLPIDASSMELFSKCGDGLILCKLINLAVNDTIDDRAINKKDSMNVYQKTENLNLALNAAKSVGCQIVNIGAGDIIEGRPILILGLLWQIIKIQLMSTISLKSHPELVVLLEGDETIASFMKLNPEVILLRWINYHLAKAGSTRRCGNFTSDIQDSQVYSILTHQLKPECTLATETAPVERAAHVIRNAAQLGADIFIQPQDIVGGNKNLNIAFVACIFNAFPGLAVVEPSQLADYMSEMGLDDAGDTREERVFRMWMNSLNIEGLYVNNLFADCEDGIPILKVEDCIQPGVVNWKKVSNPAVSKFKKVENCNMCVDIGKNAFKFSMVNIGGLDIVDRKKKLILAIVWQLLYKYTLDLLSGLATSQGIAKMDENAVVAWANGKAKGFGVKSFRDSSLKTGQFLLALIAAIEPRAVNPELVTAGETAEDGLSNARYAISCARKVGACVFLTPEDIVEGKAKMIFTFCASLWQAELVPGAGAKAIEGGGGGGAGK